MNLEYFENKIFSNLKTTRRKYDPEYYPKCVIIDYTNNSGMNRVPLGKVNYISALWILFHYGYEFGTGVRIEFDETVSSMNYAERLRHMLLFDEHVGIDWDIRDIKSVFNHALNLNIDYCLSSSKGRIYEKQEFWSDCSSAIKFWNDEMMKHILLYSKESNNENNEITEFAYS